MRNLVATAALFLLVAATVNAQTAKPAVTRKPVATTGTTAKAQPAPKPVEVPVVDKGMTNEQVVEMVNAKLAEDVIMNAIEMAPKKSFRLEAMDLVELAKCGVSNSIITVMQGKPRPVAAAPPQAPKAPVVAETPVNAPASANNAEAATTEAESLPSCEDVHGATIRRLTRITKCDPKKPSAKNAKNDSKKDAKETGDEIATPKNGQPATFTVAIPPTETCKAISKYFVANDVEFEAGTDCEVGQIRTRPVVKTGWVVDSAKRALVNFVEDNGKTEVRVKVFNKGSGFMSSNGGKKSDEKTEGVDSKGSAKMAAELRNHLQKPDPRVASK